MTREEAIAEIREKTPKLLEDYRLLAGKLCEELGIGSASAEADADKPEMEAEELQELYEAVLEFAEGYDIDSIDALLVQAKDYRIPDGEKERFANMERCVRDSDWDGLTALLKG